MITRLLSLDAIMKNPAMLAKQPAHELRETRIVAHPWLRLWTRLKPTTRPQAAILKALV